MRSVPIVRVVSGLAALVVALSLSVAPAVLAHDDSVGGAADVTITIRSGLSDRDVRVDAGDVVRFVNRDGERHRMRARSGPDEFDTGNLEPGEAFQVRLSVAGTYQFADERDRDAAAYRGRIVVEAAGDSAGGSGGSGGSAGGGAGGEVASSATVSIGDDFYDPTSIRIAVGGTVTFENTGGDEHSATSSVFDSGALSGGASFRQPFESAGTFDFLCMFHSDMRGTIEVVAAASGPAAAPSAPTTPVATPTPAPTVAPDLTQSGSAAETASVSIVDFGFEATGVVVAAGGTVSWRNTGVAPHTVTAADGVFESGMLASGDVFEQTFASPGTFDYVCAVHPDMTGTVEVVATESATASPSAAGAATIGGGSSGPTPAPDRAGAAVDGLSAGSTDVGGMAGLVVAITLISVAAGLFAKVIGGTVRA